MPKAIDAFTAKWKIGYKNLLSGPEVREYVDSTIENMSQLLEEFSKGFNISLDDEMGDDTAAEMMFKYIMEKTKNDD